MKNEKYLPLGTVVLLKNAKKRLMIIGFMIKTEESDEVYDYMGCIYPEGVLTTSESLVFNHDDILHVFNVGYQDEESINYHDKLKSLL